MQKQLVEYWNTLTPGWHLSPHGEREISNKLLLRFKPEIIKEAMDISISNYAKYDSDGDITESSFEKAISSIGGICYNKSSSETDKLINKLNNYGNIALIYWDKDDAKVLLKAYYLQSLKLNEDLEAEDFELDIKLTISESNDYLDFREVIKSWFEQDKKLLISSDKDKGIF